MSVWTLRPASRQTQNLNFVYCLSIRIAAGYKAIGCGINPGNTPIVFQAGGLDFLGCDMEFLSDPICKPDGVQPAEIFGLIGSDPAGVSLEIDTQRNLARPISAVLRGLNALDNAKGG